MKIVLGKKKHVTNEAWSHVFHNIKQYVSKDEVDDFAGRKIEEIRAAVKGKKCAIAWSAGKDSLAVEWLANQAGVTRGVFAHTSLEYPAFMEWVRKHKHEDIVALNSGHDIRWLVKHQQFLFPKTTDLHSRWYSMVQQNTVRKYAQAENIDLMLYGRRIADGNQVKKQNGQYIYTNGKGVTIYNCIAEWPHELLFGLIYYNNIPLPPIYEWENGFVEGTHSWNARNPKDKSDRTAWREIYAIDKSIVEAAAFYFESAKTFLREGSQGD